MRVDTKTPWYGKGPGAHPYVQGYWHRAERLGDTPPSWHPTHKLKSWLDEWHRGWGDCNKREPVA